MSNEDINKGEALNDDDLDTVAGGLSISSNLVMNSKVKSVSTNLVSSGKKKATKLSSESDSTLMSGDILSKQSDRC
ncbi:MAG: hypothetical protein K6A23_11450 [Butyrivibrio sp.]|nr:hypothetical protein [Butyrivibrio sp.]